METVRPFTQKIEHLRFNPHHPYGWSPPRNRHSTLKRIFQPTSLWTVTGVPSSLHNRRRHFNPLNPYRRRPYKLLLTTRATKISTHTIPANRGQHPAHHLRRFRTISILTILKGKPLERFTPAVRHSLSKSGKISYNYLNYTILLSNRQSSKRHSLSFSFGENIESGWATIVAHPFSRLRVVSGGKGFPYSPPLWRAAARSRPPYHGRIRISIRTILADGDVSPSNQRRCPSYFNPHHPCGW